MGGLELVNAVGGSDLGIELDLNVLSQSLEGDEIEYEPEVWPGMKIKFEPESPVVLVFRTGKYNIAGASSISDLYTENEKFVDEIKNLGINNVKTEFEVRNLVFLHRYEKEIDLDEMAIALGLEDTEYEPEQFPGLLYNSPHSQGTFLMFRNGKIILTGAKKQDLAEDAFSDLFDLLDSLFE